MTETNTHAHKNVNTQSSSAQVFLEMRSGLVRLGVNLVRTLPKRKLSFSMSIRPKIKIVADIYCPPIIKYATRVRVAMIAEIILLQRVKSLI